MKVQKISIKNILGIEDLEIQPGGNVTVISGKNGTGKSSVLEAIKSATKGGAHQAELVRQGQKGGEIVLVLDDDGKLFTVTKKVTEAKSSFDVRDGNGKLGSPGSRLKSFFDQIGISPVDLLTCSDKERVKLLLEAMNLKADKEKLLELSGITVSSDDALLAVDEARKLIYDNRRDKNSEAKTHRANADAFTVDAESLPSQEVDVDSINSELAEIQERVEVESNTVRVKFSNAANTLRAKISNLKIEKARIGDLISAAQMEIQGIDSAAAKEIEVIKSGAEKDATSLRSRLNSASAINASVKHRQTLLDRAQAETASAEVAEYESKDLTAKIESLDAYKAELLNSLPIEGVSIENGEVHIGGIPFSTLNNAERVKFAVRVATLRAGDCPIVCLDNSELLDSESFASLAGELEAKGFQAFMTRVSDSPLAVH